MLPIKPSSFISKIKELSTGKEPYKLTSFQREKSDFYRTTILPWAILLMLLLASISAALFLLSFGLK